MEFPLSMVQMTPACKPLTEMFLDRVCAGGRGRGRGWQPGAITSGCYFNSLAVLWCCCSFSISNSARGCISVVPSAPAKGLVLSGQGVCLGSQVKLTVYTSPSLFPGRVCQAWLVFTLGHLVLYLPATHLLFLPSQLVGPGDFSH